MKKLLATVLLFSFGPILLAQDAPQDTAFTIVGNKANSRTWERTTYEQLPSGEWIPHLHHYEEMASGLNYKNPNTGAWEESTPIIEQIPGGAVARHGQHKVIFAADLATVGAIDMETPDGKRLQSHMLGLCYYDRSSGQSVFIAQITNSIGQLISSNQVWYDDAFTGLKAGVRYTYTRDGFEQDVILEEQPLAPEAYGMNSSTTVLQAYTEFLSPPTPVIRTNQAIAGGQLSDETLSFGSMKIGRGCAFLSGQDLASCPVCKSWVTLENRQFLIEEVPILQISAQLQTLPQASLRVTNSVLNVVSKQRLLPARPLAKAGKSEMRIAKLATRNPGFVIDYSTLNTTLTNFTFQGDTTYYISGNVGLYGSSTIFEGGTVMKYATNVTLTVNTPVTWYGEPYRPVLMLAVDDNSVGEGISGSTGNPKTNHYASKALYFDGDAASSSLTITNLRVLNAQAAVVINGGWGNVLSDVQMVNCSTGISATNTDFSLRNGLMSQVLTNFTGTNATGNVEHLTSDVAVWLNKDIGANLYLTNCLLSAVANLGSCSTQNVSIVASGSGVFQTVGAGSYYLADGSIYRNAGTTNINPDLWSHLAKKTTYPPILCVNSNFDQPTILVPQIQRDFDTPDLGYHYDPMDYVFSGVNVDSNMTVSAGTAIGWFKPASGSPAIRLANQTVMAFDGRLDAQAYFVRTTTVQENNGTWGGVSDYGISGSQNQTNISLASELDMNFTLASGLAGWNQQFKDNNGYLIVRANNSIIAGGNAGGFWISCYYTNCLMDNQQVGTVAGHAGNEIYLRNCTLHNGWFYGSRSSAIPISVRDCAFDNVTLYQVDKLPYATNSAITDYSYNAYTNATDPFPSPGGTSHDQASVTYTWWQGPLGHFYLISNSPLIDAGHTTADLVGLYHFTTQIWPNSPETTSVVDIGYHYVALDDSGNPIDTDGDGTPDYLEDANGNGLVDSGETDWQSATDMGLKVIITQPKSNSTIP